MTEEEKSLCTHIGENIYMLRVTKNLTQEAFAQQCGLHASHLSLLERGKLDPKISTLYNMAKAFNVPLSEIVDD